MNCASAPLRVSCRNCRAMSLSSSFSFISLPLAIAQSSSRITGPKLGAALEVKAVTVRHLWWVSLRAPIKTNPLMSAKKPTDILRPSSLCLRSLSCPTFLPFKNLFQPNVHAVESPQNRPSHRDETKICAFISLRTPPCDTPACLHALCRTRLPLPVLFMRSADAARAWSEDKL